MNGSKIVTGSVKSRNTRIIKVAPVTRAVRAALAISVTAMALSGSGVAFAGTCTPPSSNTIYCDGSFLNTITFPDVDLTLIVGQNAPTSVTPGAGFVGIEADWPGNVNVTSYASITTTGGDGIHAYGSTSAQVVNRGNIVTAAGASAIGIDAVAYGNVNVVNAGYVGDFGTGVYDVTAVLAESTGIGYTATVYNQSSGAIIAFTDGSGTALGIEALATNGDVSVTNNGLLVAVSYYGIADGAFAAGESVGVSNGGLIYAIGSSWAAGIEAQGSDLTLVDNTGTIYAAAAGAYGHAFGVYATSGAGGTTVYNRSGDINVLGPYATGIEAQSDGGSVNVRSLYGANIVVGNSFTSYYATGISAATSTDNSNIFVYNGGGITALSHYGSTGIVAVATGAGSTVGAINTGDIYVNTSGKYASMGIVVSGDGTSQIYNSGSVTVAYGGSSYGMMALSFNDYAIVNNVGKVDVTAANYVGNGFGLVASSANGGARAYNSGTVTVNAGYYGFGIEASGMTEARVGNSGTLTVNAFKYGYGILATSGQGDVVVNNGSSGTIAVNSSYGSAFGIVGVSTAGDVSIDNSGSLSATGFYQAIGVFARADAGDVSIGNGGSIYATSYFDPAVAVVATATAGDVFVYSGGRGNIQAYSSGNTAIGINAQAGDGVATIYNFGSINATAGQNATTMQYSGALGVADGIFATGQSVRVTNSGNINATGYGWAAGIEAQASDLTVVSNVGAISATSTGAYSHAFGVYATGGTSGVSISNGGNITVQGPYATGIEAQSQGGGINIGNTGDIIVGNTGRTYYATGIDAATNYASSNVYVYNSGSVTALSRFGSTGIALAATGAGSDASVRNIGDVYVNTGGKYNSMGIIVSADGDASINTSGRVTVAYGGNSYGAVALALNGNSSVTNSGDVDVTGALLVGYGYGLVSSSANGAASAFNSGTVSVYAGYSAQGIQAIGLTGATVSNYGAIGVDAKYGAVYGILAMSGQGDVVIRNSGAGSVDVSSDRGTALGIGGISTQGDVAIYNSGSVTTSGNLDATGVFARAQNGNALATNSGDISATSIIGTAIGMLSHATDGDARANNFYGDITAYSQGNNAIGMEAVSDDSYAAVSNFGSITVDGGVNAGTTQYTGALGLADGIFAAGNTVYVRNGGSIYATGYGWAAGIEAQGDDVAHVSNIGLITAISTGAYSHAFGIYVTGGVGGLSVYSGGDITAMGSYATGIQAQASGGISINNGAGTNITVGDANTSYYATGISAVTNYANSSVVILNNGSITANSYFGSTGILAVATGPGSNGVVNNGGSVYVNTTGKYNSTGIVVSADGDATIYNNFGSSVTVAYGGHSYGEVALAFNGNASVINQGDVTVNGAGLIGYGYGIVSSSANGAASVFNSRSVSVYGGYLAMGIEATSKLGTSVNNDGAVAVDTLKYGYGILATSGQGDVAIGNGASGSVDVYSYAGTALGITGIATVGDVTIYNAGTVSASGYLDTIGIFARARDGDTTVNNVGNVYGQGYGPAVGILAHATGGNASVDNGGSIYAGSTRYAAIGIQALSDSGDVSVNNSGDIVAHEAVASFTGGAFGIYATGNSIAIDTSGDITATGYYGDGIFAVGAYQVSVNNDGNITVREGEYGSNPAGVFARAGSGGVNVTNGGSIDVRGWYAKGIWALSQDGGDITIGNAGDIGVSGDVGIGIYARGVSAGSDLVIDSSGIIDAQGFDGAVGIYAIAVATGDTVSVNNSGLITAQAANYGSDGIFVRANGDSYVSNSGEIDASGASFHSTGIQLFSQAGAASVNNSGSISATSLGPFFSGDTIGIYASGATTASVDSSGSITAVGDGVRGIQATGTTGAVVDNSGAISVDAMSQGFGIFAVSNQGDVSIGNETDGSVDVLAHSGTAHGLVGISVLGDASIDNAGSVTATGGTGGAFRVIGAYARAADTGSITNSGDITANGYALAMGIDVQTGLHSLVENSGNVVANTTRSYAGTYGVLAQGYSLGDTQVTNSGSIVAHAAGSDSHVTGVLATAYGTVTVGNSGDISAIATGANSSSIGLLAQGSGVVSVTNSGTISATDPNYAVAVSLSSGAYSTLRNTSTGTITSFATPEGNIAVLGGNGFENVLNYGYIHGAIVTNGGIDQLFNGNGGLWLVDNHSTDFGDGDDIVSNASGGTIQLTDGAIYLGADNDTINNGGLIALTDSSINLDDGDDTINNLASGTIQLTDSAIYFGAGAGNAFTNNGTIQAFGDSLIDMGTGGAPPDAFAPTLVPSLNTVPLVNNGVISFLDGAPDDVLTIIGDLGGNGAINIDVSVLNGTSDMLYVDGSIANGSVQTVNVALDQLPTTAITNIPFAHVTGNSVDGSFVFGGFAAGSVINISPSNFLNLQLDVVSQIDPTNATDDVFSIGLDVAGLNDTGTLAANVASGVQSLVNSQIGTWRQRMGVLPEKGANDAGLSPWFRVFNDEGEVDPAHVNANFAQGGNFRYDQSNSGQELGMNVNPGERGFNFGLLLNKSEGRQHLVAPGVGSDRIKTNAVGLYSTWISPKGYYVDASYRWIDFDAVLQSAGGEQSTSGHANAWNFEAGYDAWNLSGGVKITPQIQYTRTRVGDIDALHGDSATFVANGGDSSRVRLGVAFSKSIHSDSGFIWTPYGSVNAVREFDGETNYAINNAFFGSTNTEGTSAMVELGLGMQKGGLSITGGLNWTDGGALRSFTGGQLSVRYTW